MKKDIEYYKENKISPQRELAINIIEEFEDLLEVNNVKLPDRDRENKKDEANIYGITYYDLEDKLTEIIEKFLMEVNKNGKKSV